MEDETHKSKSGFVAVMGRPNVGKSTLINALLGQKVAAVSPRPQTTRKRQMGILNLASRIQGDFGDTQIVFVDTPGVHRPRHKLGELMNQEAADSLEDSDLILFVADASQPPQEDDQILFDLLSGLGRNVPVILALNKIDLIDEDTLQERSTAFAEGIPSAQIVPISATNGSHLEDLLVEIVDRLPEGYPFFPDEQVTDLYERDIAADLIREAALNILRDEVPHGIAVRIDQFTERNGHGAYIEATLFVERESHKPIIIGKNGKMLKQIGTVARQEIEAMSGRKVFLRLRVKVRKNWRNDEKILRRFGY
jgi:GTP-binding protein Era